MPCEDCEFPFYLGAIETADKKLINELLAYPSVVAEEVVEEIGLGFNRLELVVNYDDNSSAKTLFLDNDYIGIGRSVGDEKINYEVYKLDKYNELKNLVIYLY